MRTTEPLLTDHAVFEASVEGGDAPIFGLSSVAATDTESSPELLERLADTAQQHTSPHTVVIDHVNR